MEWWNDDHEELLIIQNGGVTQIGWPLQCWVPYCIAFSVAMVEIDGARAFGKRSVLRKQWYLTVRKTSQSVTSHGITNHSFKVHFGDQSLTRRPELENWEQIRLNHRSN